MQLRQMGKNGPLVQKWQPKQCQRVLPPQPIKTMMSVHGDVVGDKVGDVVGGSGWLGVGQKIPN